MKITDIRTRNICIPLSTLGKHEPVTMWYGSRFAAIKTIIFIETDEGITGLGETSIGAGGDQRLFEQIKSRLVGRDPHDINSIERGMNLTGQVTTKLGHLLDTSASSALNITGSIDQALWDIVGKAANQPIYNLIGGKYRDRVEARYWMGAKPPDKVADEVKRAVDTRLQIIQDQDRTQPGIRHRVRRRGTRSRGSSHRTRIRLQRFILSTRSDPNAAKNGAVRPFARRRTSRFVKRPSPRRSQPTHRHPDPLRRPRSYH